MISNKTIEAYKKAVKNFNKSVEKEIDSFEIDYDKVVQHFYIFVGDEKHKCVVIKHANCYNYDIKIFDEFDTVIYLAQFRISEHTGKAIIYDVITLDI